MAASALFLCGRESIVEPLTPLGPALWVTELLFFSNMIICSVIIIRIITPISYYRQELYYREKPIIPSRLRAVIDINVLEMGNLWALMKLWESRSCQKVDDYRNDEDTMARLRSFLNAMESLDLTIKIDELKRLSRHLNLVTKRLNRSSFHKAIDLITTWDIIRNFHLFLFSVSDG